MNDFTFYCPTKFVFGKQAEQKTGQLCKESGASHVLLVTGGSSAQKSGLLQRIQDSLTESGLQVSSLSGVKPNPRVSLVREGIQMVRQKGIDFILAVGGGSVIDTAKGIGIGALYDGDVWDYFLRTKNPDRMMPAGVVLTIAAAGSEGSPNCVLTNEELGIKSGCISDCMRPRFAVMNPELTYTLPPYQTACGITDIIMHTQERYFTPVPDSDLTDELCEGVLRTLIRFGPIALREPTNYNARAQIMWAGTVAHNNTVGVGRIQDSSCHRIQGKIGGKYDSAHGAGLSVVCPAWMQYVYKTNLPRFIRYATKVWDVAYDPYHPENTALEGILRLKAFFRSIGMPTTLKELGVPEEDIPELSNMETGNMQHLGPEDIRKIYELMR